MRIYDCTMFFNEWIVSKVKMLENSHWVDETHITEADRTFKNKKKKYTFSLSSQCHVKYHLFSASKTFRSGIWDFSVGPWWTNRRNCHWFNEAMQRNASVKFIDPKDEDIIIISDVDEIIASEFSDEIVWATRKHGIITVKLHLSNFYFDLFVDGWPGPPDYSYRVFVMTGKHFRSMPYTPDHLRKAGESGKLMNDVFCLEDFAGFHHSWIGDTDDLLAKIYAYSHDPEDHDRDILDPRGRVNPAKIRLFLESKRSLFSGRCLYTQDSLQLLPAIYELKGVTSNFLIRSI